MNRGFTLTEVIVVIAVLGILAGTLIPFIYRVWENTDIETTRERLMDLKKAMVGDPRLIQNGVRIHFGYVGDCGKLPSSLDKLVTEDLSECPDWKGPYLPSGFNSREYDKDAWGETIIYDSASATLSSKGIDRTQATADDITINISEKEILEARPISSVKGNVTFSFYNLTSSTVTPQYYSRVTERKYNQGTGCMYVNIGSISPGETKSVIQAYSFGLVNIIKKGQIISARAELYNEPSCNNMIDSTEINIFVTSMSEELFINIPFSHKIL